MYERHTSCCEGSGTRMERHLDLSGSITLLLLLQTSMIRHVATYFSMVRLSACCASLDSLSTSCKTTTVISQMMTVIHRVDECTTWKQRRRRMTYFEGMILLRWSPLNDLCPDPVSKGTLCAISFMISWTTTRSWNSTSLGFISTWWVLLTMDISTVLELIWFGQNLSPVTWDLMQRCRWWRGKW